MKNVFKATVLSLALALLTSCSATTELLSFLPETEDKGFGGREFVIKGSWVESWVPGSDEADVTYDSSALSLFDDSLLAHNEKIMKEYNCTITAHFEDASRTAGLLTDILANTVDYDLMDINLMFMIDNIKAGLVNPWEYADIDVTNTEKYGPSGYLEAAEYQGLHYGIWPHYWRSGIEYRGVMGVNNNLLKNYTDISVHELYENGKWTFDEFKNILKLCSVDENIYPLSYYDQTILVTCSILANGSNFVSYDDASGRYYYGMNDPKAITGIEYAKSLVDENLTVAEYDYYAIFRKEQTSVFTITETWCLGGNIENMDMTCFPFGPDAEYGEDFASYRSINNRYVFTPISTDASEVGRFVNIWFEEVKDYPKSTLLENFKTNDFFNDESYNMWLTLADKATYNYAFEIYEIHDLFCGDMMMTVFDNKSLNQFIDSYEARLTAIIDENFNK